jgi:hypothetical protein
MKTLIAITLLFTAALMAEDAAKSKATPEAASCPLHAQHMKPANAQATETRFQAMNARGEAASGMNFSQTATTHHFITNEQGGFIEVTVNDPQDAALTKTVREHLEQIAASFRAKDFSTPQFVHGELPTGTEEMIRLAGRISYIYEELPNGARVAIRTKDKDALAAVHAFLGYQLTEHRTGDGSSNDEHSH